LVRLAHLIDLGHVDPVPDVIVDIVDHDVDPLRLLAALDLDLHLLDVADPCLSCQIGDDLDDPGVRPAPLPLPGVTARHDVLAPFRLKFY